jgi:hypothetical protein
MVKRQPKEANDYSMKPMGTNVYPMVAEESSVTNPQKDAKIDEKTRKMEIYGLPTLLLPMNYPMR